MHRDVDHSVASYTCWGHVQVTVDKWTLLVHSVSFVQPSQHQAMATRASQLQLDVFLLDFGSWAVVFPLAWFSLHVVELNTERRLRALIKQVLAQKIIDEDFGGIAEADILIYLVARRASKFQTQMWTSRHVNKKYNFFFLELNLAIKFYIKIEEDLITSKFKKCYKK